MEPTLQSLFLLADGRFPMGGHVHSGGIESAMTDRRVSTVDDVEQFVIGRLGTVGLVDAALAAATVVRLATDRHEVVFSQIDAETAARIPAAALRAASRRQGRQLVRVAARCWPSALFVALGDLDPAGPHLALAMGCAVHVVGGGPVDAAALSLHHCATTPAQAAVRIGGLDPFEIAAMIARLASTVAAIGTVAVEAASLPLEHLPASSGPLLEIAAVHHDAAPTRLFAT